MESLVQQLKNKAGQRTSAAFNESTHRTADTYNTRHKKNLEIFKVEFKQFASKAD